MQSAGCWGNYGLSKERYLHPPEMEERSSALDTVQAQDQPGIFANRAPKQDGGQYIKIEN